MEEGESIMENGNRKKWTPRAKLEIVLEGMKNETGIADVCRKHGVSTTTYHLWRDRLFKNAGKVFEHASRDKPDHEVEELQAELQRPKNVIAEITSENLEFKKTPGRWKTGRVR